MCLCVAVECNESVFTERSGEITSADFPKPYPKSSECVYRIELEEGFQITLEFDDTFDIESHPEVTCPYDSIKVRNLKLFTYVDISNVPKEKIYQIYLTWDKFFPKELIYRHTQII